MKEMLEDIVSSIVTKPSEIKINEKTGESGVVILELSVAPEDMGKVIGRRGKVANSIRTLIKAAASKADRRVIIEIV